MRQGKRIFLFLLMFLSASILFGCGFFDNEDIEIRTFLVSFNVNQENYREIQMQSNEILLPTENPTKTGYTFMGWYLDEDLFENEFDSTDFNQIPEHILTLTVYAKFNANTYTVNLDHQGGQSDTSYMTVTYDDDLPEIPEPTKDGYIFMGYVIDSTLIYNRYLQALQTWSFDYDATLSAVWSPKTIVISFDGNDATEGSMNTYSAVFNTEVTLPENQFIKENHLFLGWSSQMDGVVEYTREIPFLMSSTEDLTLYAVWQGESVNVTLMFEDEPLEKELTYSESYELPIPIKEGYNFTGWYDAPTDGMALTDAQGISLNPWSNDDLVTLYPQFLPNQYELTFDAQGGSDGTQSTTVTYHSALPNIMIPTRLHYDFLGYFTEQNGKGTQYYNENGQGLRNWEISADTWLYAHYAPTLYRVVFDKQGGTGGVNFVELHINETLPEATAPSKTGYTFKGYYKDKDGSGDVFYDADMTPMSTLTDVSELILYAKWEAKLNTVLFDRNGAQSGDVPSIETYTGQTIILPNNTYIKDGYIFSGWRTLSDSGHVYLPGNVYEVPGQDVPIVLYAYWIGEPYVITFDQGLGSHGTTEIIVRYGNRLPNIAKPIREGYEFSGYFSEENGMGIRYYYNDGTSGTTWLKKVEITLYAYWLPIKNKISVVNYEDSYTISFDLNGGSTNYPIASQVITLDNHLVYPDYPYRSGYIFAGWFMNKNTSGNPYDFSKPVSQNMTLYAKWVPYETNNIYTTISLDKPVSYSQFNFIYETFAFTPLTSGYVTLNAVYPTMGSVNFKAEFLNANKQLITSKTGQSMTLSMQVTAGQVYYLRFSVSGIVIKINFTLMKTNPIQDGGTFDLTTIDLYTDSDFPFELLPTKENYDFAGYYSEKDGQGLKYFNADGTVTNENWYKSENKLFYAHWTNKIYEITFDDYVESRTFPVTYLGTLPTVDLPEYYGYHFGGYYTAKNGQGVQLYDYELNQLVESYNFSGNVTLYAYWIPNQHTIQYDATGGEIYDSYVVTFDLNGFGYNPPASQVIDYDHPLQYPDIPRTSGYAFAGWYDNRVTTGTPYDFSQIVTSDITLYAKWVPYIGKIIYGNEEKASIYAVDSGAIIGFVALKTETIKIEVTKYYPQLVSMFSVFSLGTDYNSTPVYYGYGHSTTIIINVVAGTVYYYSFKPYNDMYYTPQIQLYVSATSTEIADGGIVTDRVAIDEKTAIFGQPMPYEMMPTKTGYIFAGYYDMKDGQGQQYYNELMESVRDFDVDQSLKLYAKWQPIEYRIIYNGNQHDNGLMDDSTHYYDIESQLNANQYSRIGYEFIGWSDTSDGPVKYIDEASIINLINQNQTAKVLYAKWQPITYQIQYDGNGADFGSTEVSTHIYDVESPLNPNGFVKEGYVFGGWMEQPQGEMNYNDSALVKNLSDINGDTVTLYANWIGTYQIHYDGNGADGGTMSESRHALTQTVTLSAIGYLKTGYIFQGWSDTGNGVVVYIDQQQIEPLSLDHDSIITLYAVWAPITYSISYNGNSHNAGTMASKSHIYDQEQVLEKNLFTKYNHVFIGWSLSSGGSVLYQDMAVVVNLTSVKNGVVTLYAVWHPIYEIYYSANGGYPNQINHSEHLSNTISYLRLNTFERLGYHFIGWANSQNGNVILTDGEAIYNLNQTLISNYLYAVWAPNSYLVTFDKMLGSGGDDAITARYLEAMPEAVAPTREGYTFAGYYENADGTGLMYYDKNMVSMRTWNKTEPNYLYAKWQVNTYTIKYDGNQSTSGSMSTQRHTYDNSIKLSSNQFSRIGYQFLGWSTSVDGTVRFENNQIVKNIGSELNEIITLYAIWNPITYQISYDGNGFDTGFMENSIHPYDYNQALTLNTYEKTGYLFLGWSTSKTSAAIYTDGEIIRNLTQTQDDVIELYANWGPMTYYIEYNGNGHDLGLTESTVHTYDAYQSLAINRYTKAGYVFAGWSLDPDSSTQFSDTDYVVNLLNEHNATLTLYAVWIEAGDVYVHLYHDGLYYDVMMIPLNTEYTLPILEDSYGWFDEYGVQYTDASGVSIIQMTDSKVMRLFSGKIPIENTVALKNIQMHGHYFMVTNLDLYHQEWTPFESFTGIFDGNGFSISNLKITGQQDMVSLFKENHGTIKNLNIVNFNIDVDAYRRDINVAGVAILNHGTIDNVHWIGSMIIDHEFKNQSTRYAYVGGLVSFNDGLIQNSSATVDITINIGTLYFETYSTDTVMLGGLIGVQRSTGITKHSSASIEIDSKAGYSSSDSTQIDIGGLIGQNSGLIEQSYTEGYINVIATRSITIGGLVSRHINNSITGSHASVTVTVQSPTQTAGGLIGYNDGDVSYSYATGNVNGISFASGSTSSQLGGLIGFQYNGNISNSYAGGNIEANASSLTSAYQSDAYAGGLIGRLQEGVVKNTYATGDVIAKASNYAAAGGLVGLNQAMIINSYAIGSVTANAYGNAQSNSVLIVAYAGGLVGRNTDSVSNSFSTGKVVARSYKATNVSSLAKYEVYIGRILGSSGEFYIRNLYHADTATVLSQLLQNTSQQPTNIFGVSVTVSTLKQANFLTETLTWSTDDWVFETNSYPILSIIGK